MEATMRIEEMNSTRLRAAPVEELRDLRRRCVNLWVKCKFHKGAERFGEIKKSDFVTRYARLRIVMKERGVEPRRMIPLDELVASEVLRDRSSVDQKKALIRKKLTPERQAEFDAETEKIRESRETARAQARHKFVPAEWTEKNGHPRCKVCGMEEPLGGICKGAEEWPDDWKAALAKFMISKPETTDTAQRIPVAPIAGDAEIRTMAIDAENGISALYDAKNKVVVTYIFDKDKWTMAEARKWTGEHGSKAIERSDGRKAEFQIFKLDERQHIVGGIVYEPLVVDTQKDFTDEKEIEKAMYGFMEKYFADPGRIRVMHRGKSYSFPILECFQAEEDTKKGGGVLKKGAWWMMVKVTNDEIWTDIVSGKLTGFSMGGRAAETTQKADEVAGG
jgi:hypothetical protein